MSMRISIAVGLAMAASFALAIAAQAYSIPPEKIDEKQIYWGQWDSFEKPSEIKYEDVVQSTPEYTELKKKKVARGTGKYWILMSQSSDRTVRAIGSVAPEQGFDLVAADGYLEGLEIPAEDITKTVVEEVQGKRQKATSEAKSE